MFVRMEINMQKQLRKISFWCVAAFAAILSGIALMIAAGTGREENIQPSFGESRVSLEKWTSIENDEERLINAFPYEVQGSKGVFYCQIPGTVTEGDVLVFANHYQKISVSIEDEEIYSYGMKGDSKYFMPANLKCFIGMLPEYRGKIMKVKIFNGHSPLRVVLDQPVWSTGWAIVLDTLRRNLAAGCFCIVSGIGGILLLAAAGVFAVKKGLQTGKILISLGSFMLLSSLWILTDSGLLQLCMGNSQLILITSFETFFVLPIPFLCFMEQISIHKTKVFRWLRYAFALNCIIQNILYLTATRNFLHMVLFTHVIIFASIIYIIYFMVNEYVHYRLFYAKGILVGIAGFVCMSGFSIIVFYSSRGNADEHFFIAGFALLVLDFLWMSVRKIREFTEAGMREKVYKELAFQDVLTGLGNRNLYENRLELHRRIGAADSFSVAVLDINGLKGVNDTYGHGEGDKLIRDGAECIQKVFADMGQCFRIGGDEFVVLMPDREIDSSFCREKLWEELTGYNKDRGIQLSLAAGFAVKKKNTYEDRDLAELIEMADQDMYREKNGILAPILFRKKVENVERQKPIRK